MKNYNTKKKITIAVLAVVAVFLAGGLLVYMDSMNNKEPAGLIADDITQAPDDITAPEIKIPTGSTAPVGNDQPETQGTTSSSSGGTGEQSKPSDGQPKTPAEATPPPTPETDHEPSGSSSTNAPSSSTPTPAQPDNTPKSGDTNDKGEIYVPGFGWIPNEGGGVDVQEGDFELSGELIGDM